jgi:hypothetical protein
MSGMMSGMMSGIMKTDMSFPIESTRELEKNQGHKEADIQ